MNNKARGIGIEVRALKGRTVKVQRWRELVDIPWTKVEGGIEMPSGNRWDVSVLGSNGWIHLYREIVEGEADQDLFDHFFDAAEKVLCEPPTN